jgi:predicted deacylase
VPYVLLDRKSDNTFGSAYDLSMDIARQTGFYIVEDAEFIHGSLSNNLIRQGIPALTFELGESYVVNEKVIEYGVKSILGVLAYLDMITFDAALPEYPLNACYHPQQIIKYCDKPLCTKSGIIRFLVKPGEMVNQGKQLAKVYNAFGKLQETLFAIKGAIVLGTSDSAVAFPGMSPMVFGVF